MADEDTEQEAEPAEPDDSPFEDAPMDTFQGTDETPAEFIALDEDSE
jgi:hypothetical protein